MFLAHYIPVPYKQLTSFIKQKQKKNEKYRYTINKNNIRATFLNQCTLLNKTV